jgi:hypothetical protein
MVIYMDQYRAMKTTHTAGLKCGTYGDEILDASWNPAVLPLVLAMTNTAPSPELPDDLSTLDVDEFLARVYGLATLI